MVSARMNEDKRGVLVVARFKVSGQATAEAIAAQLEASFRPGDLLSARGAGQYAAVLTETTVAEAAGLLTDLAKALTRESSTLSFGLAQAGEGDPERLLALAAERMVSAKTGGEPSTRFVAVDPAMKAVMALVDHAAGASTHVLMMGETGTGKDLIARLIHERSRRASGPLVRLSCVTLSESFDPAAVSAQIGRARGGTVTLDELSALSPRAQRGLGHLLDEAQASGLDARIIAFAGPEIGAAVQSGAFRKDLYYRLNQLEITLPPLRERRADIVPLAEQLLSEVGEGQRLSLSSSVRAKLEAYDWPGNVRELKNAMERALLHARGAAILVEHLPGAIRGPSEPSVVLSDDRPLRGLRDELAALEKRRILEALEKYPTQKEAAEALEMPMRTFLNRLDALGIQRARGGGRPRDETEEHE
jgi:DNA-binding NtrC family response regulator